jgi:hypothetical protein
MAFAIMIQRIENCVFFFCGTLLTFPCTLISCLNWHMEQVHHFKLHHQKQEIASHVLLSQAKFEPNTSPLKKKASTKTIFF